MRLKERTEPYRAVDEQEQGKLLLPLQRPKALNSNKGLTVRRRSGNKAVKLQAIQGALNRVEFPKTSLLRFCRIIYQTLYKRDSRYMRYEKGKVLCVRDKAVKTTGILPE